MTFPTDDILLGPASFGGLHRLDMLIGHTGEEPGFSRDYAVKTTIWQRTNPGSYNFRIYDAASAGARGGVLLTVPYLVASGGINPSSDFWAPERFPFLERELARAGPCPESGCPGPYRNPTMHAGQIGFTGRTVDLATRAPANYVADAERLIVWYDGRSIRGPAPLVLVMHAHWQRNRSDWGAWMHAQLTASEEDDMPTPPRSYKPELWTVINEQGAALREQADASARVVATIPKGGIVFTVGQSDDGLWRDALAGDPERLYFARRRDLEAMVPGGDAALHAGIAAVVNARVAGQPVPSGGIPKADLDAAIEQIRVLTGRVQVKDTHIAQYPRG